MLFRYRKEKSSLGSDAYLVFGNKFEFYFLHLIEVGKLM